MATIKDTGLKTISANVDYLSNYANIFNPLSVIYQGTSSTPITSTSDTVLLASTSLGTFKAGQHLFFTIAYSSVKNANISKVAITNSAGTTNFTTEPNSYASYKYYIHQLATSTVSIALWHRNRSTTNGYVDRYTISVVSVNDGDLPNE
jgi:hypothetical protein